MLTEELRGLDEFLVLRQVDENDRLNIAAICCVSKETKGCEQRGDNYHNASKRTGELLRFLH